METLNMQKNMSESKRSYGEKTESAKLCIFISHPSDFLTDCEPHGDGLVAFEYIKHLANKGHQIHIVVDKVKIKGQLSKNIHIYPTNLSSTRFFLRRILYAVKVRSIFNRVNKTSKIDIVHQLNPVVPGLSLLLFGTKPPFVVGPIVASWPPDAFISVNSSIKSRLSNLIKEFARSVVIYLQQVQSDALLIATPAASNRIKNPKSVSHKLYDLRHGIDQHKFSPIDENDIRSREAGSSEDSILFMGSIEHHKGVITLLEAFSKVRESLPNCKLIIAGNWGRDEREMKERIGKIKSFLNIEFIGPVPRDKVVDVIRSCTVYCVPSYGEAYGMGALEAMACGKPIVGTDAGGLSYLISEEGGRKVAPKNAQALADALIEVLSKPQLQREMGHHNRNLVENIYSWDKIIEQLESVYDKLLQA